MRLHPLVAEALAVEPRADAELERLGERLARKRWDWVISLDDEESLCRFASRMPAERLSGAHLDAARRARAYTPDVAPWFDMGLLSVHGKARGRPPQDREHAEPPGDLRARCSGSRWGSRSLPPAARASARVARGVRRGLHGLARATAR